MARLKPRESSQKRRLPPASSPEARENQLIALAYDVAEERLLNGTATSQEVCHFLRLGSMKERKELEMMNQKNELMKAKTEALQSAKRIEELYTNAINAFKSYRGDPDDGDYDADLY